MTGKRKRGWFQFSLRTLRVFVLLVSIGLSWLGVKLEGARRQREAVEAIEKLGMSVDYDDWLDLHNTQITDAGLEHLKEMTNLARLNLEGTHVTPEGVKKLQESLPECEIVY